MSALFSHGYALLIGVGDSQYPKLSLPVTVKDTQAIYGALTDRNFTYSGFQMTTAQKKQKM